MALPAKSETASASPAEQPRGNAPVSLRVLTAVDFTIEDQSTSTPSQQPVALPNDDYLAELAEVSRGLKPDARRSWNGLTRATPPSLRWLPLLAPRAWCSFTCWPDCAQTAIFNLDTGYQFAETLELRERVLQHGIDVELKRPVHSVEEYERLNGGRCTRRTPTGAVPSGRSAC